MLQLAKHANMKTKRSERISTNNPFLKDQIEKQK